MCAGTGEKPGVLQHELAVKLGVHGGFTLIELLVVMSIIALLMSILVPALAKVRRHARSVLGIGDQHHIVKTLLCYALDNDGLFPESVATVGEDDSWNWQEPTMMTGVHERSPRLYRSMSAYLRSYIADASVMSCRNAPKEHEYLQEAWDAGEEWDNPDALYDKEPMVGAYCFYWNYVGCLTGRRKLFKGPSGTAGGPGESKLLVSCYLGYDHYRNRRGYSSCEKFRGAGVVEETPLASAWWSGPGSDVALETLKIKLHAGYSDGHVADYSTSDVVSMEVIMNRATTEPYPPGVGPGVFYLPSDALH